MPNIRYWQVRFLALALTAGTCFAQNPEPPKFYKLEFVLKEVEAAKVLNARSYSITVSTDTSQHSSIRTGSKVPTPTGGAASPPKSTFFTAKTVREEFLFTGSQGTFMVHAEERAFGPGVWQIEPGTGAYAATSGHGNTAFTFVPTPCSSTFALTGVAAKVS